MRGVMLAAVLLVLVACSPQVHEVLVWQPTAPYNPDGYTPVGAVVVEPSAPRESIQVGTYRSTLTEHRMIIAPNSITIERYPEPLIMTYHSYNPAEEQIYVTLVSGPRAGERFFYELKIYANGISFGNPPEMFELVSR